MFRRVFNFTILVAMQKVSFFSADRRIPLKSRKLIKKLIRDLFKREKTFFEGIDYIFCSDKYLLKINRDYLKHSFNTDVITFCLSESSAPISGEVYLSTDRIKENAKAYEQRYQTEVLRVMIHGALHLCGYKDKTTTQKKEMHLKEEFYLRLYFKRFT